ncbi:hypothetical protein TNCV_185781 [Trichonephila clavipes]|nr:hypothetical protein TNCV_185781 [Trichonephila clavipes]
MMVVENQPISSLEEPERMANANSDAPKKPVSVFISNYCLQQQNMRGKKEKAKKPNSPVASTSKDGAADVLVVKRNIVSLQQKNGSSTLNDKSGGMRNVPIMKMSLLFVNIVSCTTKHFNITFQCITLSL